jgi:hypothetical protein
VLFGGWDTDCLWGEKFPCKCLRGLLLTSDERLSGELWVDDWGDAR